MVPANADTNVAVRDITGAGIGLLIPRRIAPGTLVGLALPAPQTPDAVVLASVVHATTRPGRMWHTGCRFTLDLDDDDLSRFVSGKGKRRFVDRRTEARRPCDAQVTCWQIETEGVRRLEVAPVRANARMAVFRTRGPVPLGMVLEWKLPGALTMLSSVARIACEGDCWAVTGLFIRELIKQELRAVLANLNG